MYSKVNQLYVYFRCSVTQSCPTFRDPMDHSTPGFPVLHYLSEFAQTLRPLSQWWYPTISSSVIPFSFCLQSFTASGSFPMSHLFASGGWSIGASALVLPVNIQGWFHLGLTDLISLQPKGILRVFNTTDQKHQFFSAQPYLWSKFLIHTWLLENVIALTIWTFVSKVMSLLFNKLSSISNAMLYIFCSSNSFLILVIDKLFNHYILCNSLLLLPSIFHSIRAFSKESALHTRWPKYWSFLCRGMNVEV